ncbi:MAG: hypothetical protein Q8940_02975 [Bacteroidota bacterium]|nr:hypothetical protein [Bacteroidota bacterium]
MLRDMKIEQQKYKTQLYEDEELTDEDKKNLKDEIDDLDDQQKYLYHQMVTAYNEYVPNQDDPNLKPIIDTKNISFKYFLNDNTPIVRKWIEDKLSQKIDRATGRLKEGYCMISQDIARMHSLKTGDKVLMSITPTDSLMGGNVFEVASVLGEDISASNKVVLPSEYIQAVGKDYDVDVVSLYPHDRKFYTDEEWKALTDKNTTGKIYQEYVSSMFDLMTGDKFNLQVPERIKQLPNWKEAFVTDEKVHLQFMQKYLGSAKEVIDGEEREVSKSSYGLVGKDALKLGDSFRKEVAPIVTMRTLHTLLTKIGLTSKVASYDINPKQNWLTNHIAHLIATNDRVDFPKRTNQLQYDSNPLKLEAKMYNSQLYKDYETSLAVSLANKFIFQEVIELPRGTDIMFGGGRDLNDTLQYMKTASEKMDMLKEGTDRTSLIKGAKKFATDSLSGNKQVNKALVLKQVEEYIKNIKVENPDGYSGINMARNIDTQSVENARKGVQYDTYRGIEAKVFDSMLTKFKGLLSKSGGYNMFDDQLRNLSKITDKDGNQIYAGLDEADKRVVSLVLALNSLDYKRGTTYDKSNKDKSLYLLREELVQIARPVQEKAGTKASVVTEARSRVFPSLMKLLLNQKAFVFAKGTERGDKVTLKKDGLSVEVYRDQYDQLKVNYETKEKRLQGIDAQNIKNIPELSDLFYGRDNLFNDSKYANENKSSFSSLVPVSSDNISSEDRNTLLKDWLSSRLTDSKGERNYSDSDLKMIFTSLLVPYQNRTLLGRLDEKQSYIKAFTNFRDKLMSETGQEPTKRQIINYNLAIDHFKNDAKINMEYLKKLFQDAKIPMPMLEISMNRNNLSRPFISQKGGYQSNDLVLELSSHFTPEFTEDYWEQFRQYNTLDTVKMENDKQIALRSDSTDTSVDYLPDFDNTSRSKWFDDAVTKIEERDQSVDKLLSKSKIAQLWEFKKIVKDDPKRAFKYLQAAADNIDILVALSATDHADFTLNDVIKDIRNGSYEKFARIYDSIPSRRASEMYSKLDMNNLENSGKRMAGTLYQMLKAKESFEKKGKMWFRDVSNIHTFAMDYGQKPFNRMSDLDLKVCKLNVSSDPLENMKVQPVLDQEKVFNANTLGWVGDVQVFAYRSKYWTDQVKETMGEMNAYLTAHRSYKNDLADHLKIETPEARAKMNKDVWDFAEREFNKDPKLNGKIEFVNDQGGVKVSYDGSIIDEEVLATRLFGDDPVKRYSFLSALQMRKLYDSDVPKVLTNAKVYFEDVYSKLMKMNSDVSRQNAKYIASIIYRYDEVLKAIHNPYDTETSYMPHMIRDEEQFRTQFKLLHWDSALKQALETRDVERKKVQKGIAGADAMIASMTNQQIEEKLKQKLDEHLDNMKIDNPLIPVNANWKERIMYENDLYTKTDDTPNISYMDNLQRTLSNDLLIADSYLYQARSIASNENPYVMETMRLWYGNQLTNKLLHTKPLAKSKLRPGMEIQFMRQVPMVTVSNGIKSFDFAGKLISSTKNSITVELPNGSTKTHQFDADISATEGYREQMHWGQVSNVTKDEISLKNGETTTSYKTKDLYSRDVGYRKDELNLQRYMVRGTVERLNGLMREEGYNEDKKKDFRYYLMKAPATLANFQERWTSMMILGGLSSVRSGLRNLVGGVMELISYGPFKYSRYIAKGREMFRKAATYDPLRQGKEAQSVRQIAQFKQAMVQEGLLPSMVSLSSEFVNAVAFGTTETELSSMAKDLNVDPNSFKDFKTFVKILLDKTDYTEHKAKMDAIREKMMTSDPKKRMVAELDLKKEEVFYKAKVNGIALQTDQMWTNQEIDRLLNTLPEAEDIGSLTNIDRNLAWKMMMSIIDHKLSGPFMKLFTLPEAMLRKNSFYVGYYEWLDTHPGDTHGALENAHKRVAVANALYTSAEKQFGNKTALGKLIYKFAQYSMNQYQVYRRMIPEAEQQIIEHGWKSLNPLQTYVKGEEGEKVNVGTENSPVYVLNLGKKLTSTILLNSLMIGSASSGLYGLSSLANPVLSMVVAWIKLLIGSGQDNPDKKKRDQELMQNLSESLPWIGFGLKNPIQAIATGQYGNMDPITSNTNYKIAKSIMEQAVPGGEDPNLIYQLIGFSESTPKKSSK